MGRWPAGPGAGTRGDPVEYLLFHPRDATRPGLERLWELTVNDRLVDRRAGQRGNPPDFVELDQFRRHESCSC